MSRKWDVRVDERPYTIERKGAKVLVNGEKFKIRKLSHESGFFQSEYQVPVGSKTALLVIDMVGSAKLIIDGKDCATGEDYVPQKLPGWAWIFVVLHFINCLNGAIGALVAIVGLMATFSISCNRKINVVVRVLLDIVILVAALGIVFGIALAIVGSAY